MTIKEKGFPVFAEMCIPGGGIKKVAELSFDKTFDWPEVKKHGIFIRNDRLTNLLQGSLAAQLPTDWRDITDMAFKFQFEDELINSRELIQKEIVLRLKPYDAMLSHLVYDESASK